DWIDWERGVARLPDSKTGAKNLHLSPPALALLRGLARVPDNPHVLPGDRQGAAAFVGIQKPWQRIWVLAGLPNLRIHDLRSAFEAQARQLTGPVLSHGKTLNLPHFLLRKISKTSQQIQPPLGPWCDPACRGRRFDGVR